MLKGKRILEWTSGAEGAFCGRILAELGAEVIKIENPLGGDELRREGPAPRGGATGESPFFGYINAGKKSVSLDPESPSGWALFEKLAGLSDLLVETELSRGRDGAYKIDKLRKAHGDLAIVTLTATGLAHASNSLPHSPLTLQHRSSYAVHQALPVSDPARRPPVGCAEREASLIVGVTAAIASIWSLLVADSHQGAPHVDVSAHDFYAAHLYPGPLAEWGEGEREFKRARGAFGGTEVAGGLVWMLECTDGWVMASPREQHQWSRWINVLGTPEWSKNAVLCGDRNARRHNYVELRKLMSEWTRSRTRQEVFDAAREARVACFPINEVGELLDNAQLHARKFFNTLTMPGGLTVPVPGLPFEITTDAGKMARGHAIESPTLGGANDEILQGRLGLLPADVEALRAGGIIG